MNRYLFLSALFLSTQAFALVDYTESEFKPQNSGASSVKAPAKPATRSFKKISSAPRGASSGSNIDFGVNYEGHDVELNKASGKVHFINLKGHIQTRYNVFLDFSYWQANSTSSYLSQSGESQKGNPEMILGFNWLQWGGRGDTATVDLFAGMNFGQGGSAFASSASAQTFGISTAKRFHTLALGLGYQMYLLGTPSDFEEKETGNVQKLSASLGWMVRPDIRFILEGNTYSISRAADDARVNRLEEDIQFSTVSPKLNLSIAPSILFELGAHFRTRRLKNDDLIDAKLYKYKGAYGNSYFVGLNFVL